MDGNLFFVCFALFCFDERWTAFQPTSTKAPLMLPHKFRLKWKMRQPLSLCRWQSLGNGKVCNSFCVYSLHLDCLSSLNMAGSTWFNSSVRTWLQRLDHAKRQELSTGLQLGLSLVMLFCRCCCPICPTAKGSSASMWLSQECLGDWVLAIHDELLQLLLFRTTMRGRQVQKKPDENEDSRRCDCGMQSGQTENAQGLPTTWLQPRLGLPIISPPASPASAWCIDAGGLRIWSQCIAEDGQPSGTQLINSTFATNQQSSGRWKEASQMQRTV